jgi:hypothetical protein
MPRFLYLLLLAISLEFSALSQNITSFSPREGNAGTPVTITGTALDVVTGVSVNGIAGVILSRSPSSLRFLVMPGSSTGAISVAGAATVNSADAFTVTNSPLSPALQGKLVGYGASGAAHQGRAVAISADGNTLAVGGDQDTGGGATWIFAREGTLWSQQGQKLVGTGALGFSAQGYALSISADGHTLAVGGYGDSSGRGAVWIFTRNGIAWTQQAKLSGSGMDGIKAWQGYSIGLSADGNTLAVGGDLDSSYNSWPIARGATWVFSRTGTTWTQMGSKLIGSGGSPYANQGCSIGLASDGKTLAVGGYGDDGGRGAVWIFVRNGNAWVQQGAKLVGTGGSLNAEQGSSVSLSADGNTLAIGGIGDNGKAGAVWIFTRSGTGWARQGSRLIGTDAVGKAAQGNCVALSADGNTLVESGYWDDSSRGATWIFTRNGSTWSQQDSKIVGIGALGKAGQGRSLALSADGRTLAVGGSSDHGGTGASWIFSAASSFPVGVLADRQSGAVSFWPNPVTDKIIISGGSSDGLLQILDGSGKLVLSTSYRSGLPVNLSSLASGLYWVRLHGQKAVPLVKL